MNNLKQDRAEPQVRREMLYDELRRRQDLAADVVSFGREVKVSLDNCESAVFEISNVAEYVVNSAGKPIYLNRIYDVFPPFEQFWMEFQRPGYPLSEKVGVLWRADKHVDASGWTCCAQVFQRHAGEVDVMLFAAKFTLTSEGIFKDSDLGLVPVRSTGQNAQPGDSHKHLTAYLIVCFQAISFMHMHRNCVQVQDNRPIRALRRDAERKGVKPPVTFKTILVRAMGRSGNGNYENGNGGKAFAWHLVRGHMMRATAERPLFGKPWGVGAFWVASHTKGKPEHGRVVNTYNVAVPTPEPLQS